MQYFYFSYCQAAGHERIIISNVLEFCFDGIHLKATRKKNNMKKILLFLAVLAIALVANAGVKIDWEIRWGAYDHSAPNVTDDPSTHTLLDHYSVTWQLIYAGANGAIEVPDSLNAANGFVGTGPGADDVVWATRTIAMGGGTAPQDGTVWDHWLMWDGLNGSTVYKDYTWTTAGSVYQRIYEGAPAQLSWYFDSSLLPFGTGFDASNEHFTPDYLTSGTGTSGIKPNLQVPAVSVPEPATMGLLGLGALVMAIRRRRS
jgi:hypothetical protein